VFGNDITTALCEQYDRTWSNLGDPRTPSTAHRPLATYKHWFWTEEEERRTYLHTAAVPRRIALRVANFRFGHQCLRVNQRYTSDNLPFASRTCSRCTSGAIDDAAHLLFECTGADLPHVRTRFGALLTSIPAHSDAAGQLQFISNTANQDSMAFSSQIACARRKLRTTLPAIGLRRPMGVGIPTPIDASASEEVL
jgi:hypothetical protein